MNELNVLDLEGATIGELVVVLREHQWRKRAVPLAIATTVGVDLPLIPGPGLLIGVAAFNAGAATAALVLTDGPSSQGRPLGVVSAATVSYGVLSLASGGHPFTNALVVSSPSSGGPWTGQVFVAVAPRR